MNLHNRDSLRETWVRETLHDPGADLARASADASFRSYWRAHTAGGTRIVMDSPPDKEDVRPWLRLRDVLDGFYDSDGVIPCQIARWISISCPVTAEAIWLT